MDWNTFVQNIDFFRGALSTVFSAVIYKIININLNNLNIPKDWKEFEDRYGFKLEKIIGNTLEEISKDLEEIITHTLESNNCSDEDSFKLIDEHNSFFKGTINSIRFSNFELEIKELYSELTTMRKYITNLCAILFLCCIICISVVFFDKSIIFLILIIITLLCFEIIKSYLKFRGIVSKINDKILIIDENYRNIRSFGEKYGN